MGKVIRMDSKFLVKEFLPKVNHKDFQFILISDDIKNNKKKSNVCKLRALLPSVSHLTLFEDGKKKKYKSSYLEFLNNKEVEKSYVMPIVVGAKKENMNIVLVCSSVEDDYGFLKLICKHLDKKFNIDCMTGKKFLESK